MVLENRLPEALASRLAVPIIAAPMFRVSGPDLVVATCRAGIVGAFPTVNARTVDELDAWLVEISARLRDAKTAGPVCANLVMKSPRALDDAAVLARRGVDMVITSVGSPRPVVAVLHDAGALIFSDVATVEHARKAIEAGADGLVLLTAGAGGQTGWLNPFAFTRAVREFYDGPIVLGGGMSDGFAVAAARVLGADLGYVGTRFIAAQESMAGADYRELIASSTIDDIHLTRAFTGRPGNMLRPSIVAAGLDPDALDENVTPAEADAKYGRGSSSAPKRYSAIYAAGHTVSGAHRVESAADIVEQYRVEYLAALQNLLPAVSHPVAN